MGTDARERRRLRLRLLLFFLALGIPSALLLFKALDQLKWEALRQTQLVAESVILGIDERLAALIQRQDSLSFADFSFLTLVGDPSAGFVQRSVLSSYPVEAALPGLIGWFQIDDTGRLSTPLLPPPGVDARGYGIDAAALASRQALTKRIGAILGSNALVTRATDTSPDTVPASPSVVRQTAAPMLEQDAVADKPRGQVPSASYATAEPVYDQAFNTKSQAIFERLSAAAAEPTPADHARTRARRGDLKSLAAIEEEVPVPAETDDLTAHRAPARVARRERTVMPEPFTATATSPSGTRERTIESFGQGAAARNGSPAAPFPAAAPEVAMASPDHGGSRDREAARGEMPRGQDVSTPGSMPVPRPLIRTFESELDPFRFSLLNSGHFVLFRWAWRDGARYVQGGLIDPEAFLSALVAEPFRNSTLQRAVSLRVNWDEQRLAEYPGVTERYDLPRPAALPAGTVIHRGPLQEPFGALRLEFDAVRLPTPPGASLVYWLGGSLGLVLCVGTWGLYRLGLHQLHLLRQQQDFVAAVSHELKTPLTSIRMYSEMLQAGWVTDGKRGRYHRYIQDESERLSRLVTNVLQLARINRGELSASPRPMPLSAAVEQACATLSSQAEQAGFELVIQCLGDAVVNVDPDALTQVLINLVDNAVKFSAKAPVKRIEIRYDKTDDGNAWIGVRDHGPGVPKAEHRRAFELFKRLENERTRGTKGTGIGLALVQRLMRAMGGEAEMFGREPGVEVRLWLARS